MALQDYLVHERTLAGAVDSFLKGLVHVRPQLVSRYEKIAAEWLEAWFADGGVNELVAVEEAWLVSYLETCSTQREQVEQVLRTFYRWAVREKLVDAVPLR